jgi:lipopolysaccharide/colanic/teichoic acid biosynthesis glycosyltransferase
MIKRLFDIVFSLAVMVVLLPVYVLVTIIIYIEDRQNPFFTQWRYGKDDKPFLMYKFRTMRIADDNRKIVDLKKDYRVTRVGRFFRATTLDEYPQMLNIYLGDMSFVGPRPIPCDMQVKDIPNWQKRNKVKPGCIGLAQVYCIKHTTLRDKFRFDALYAKRMSILLDIKIALAAMWVGRRMIAFAACTLAVLLITLLPIGEDNIPYVSSIDNIDKAVHFIIFGVMVFISLWFFNSIVRFRRAMWNRIIWSIVLAVATELLQSIIPNRNTSILDLIANLSGIASVAVVSIKLRRMMIARSLKYRRIIDLKDLADEEY